MSQKGNKVSQIAGFILVFCLALSGFEFLETGQINWYRAPLNTAQKIILDRDGAPFSAPISVDDTIEFTGRVTSVTDGDTLRIMDSTGQAQIIRLYGIDAPERDQPYGTQATTALRQKLANAQIRIIQQDTDEYGRYVGTIFLGDRNINLEMVAGGHAWWYEFFAPDDRELNQAQREAQDNNLGLWQSSNPIDPYQWRRTH